MLDDNNMIDVAKLNEVLSFLNNAPTQRVKLYDKISDEDLIITDLLHYLENNDLGAKDKRIVADELKKARQRRRKHKVLVEQLDEVIAFYEETNYNYKSANRLVSRIQHRQERANDWKYTPRTHVLQELFKENLQEE